MKGGHTSRAIEVLILQALVLQAQGNSERAHIPLERALSLAEPGGYVRTFVDEGPPMARLLYEALARGIAPDYTRRLLAAFPVAGPELPPSPVVRRPSSALVEPLSEREAEILELIAEGLTNREIASRLFLSLNTVNAHTRNAYGKLAVHSRTGAVARARALRLLASIQSPGRLIPALPAHRDNGAWRACRSEPVIWSPIKCTANPLNNAFGG
jgi:LuxR family maltose regulon positive regulatory protein